MASLLESRFLRFIALALLVTAAFIVIGELRKSAVGALAGTPPPIDATAIDGRRVSLSDLRGKVVLIDFWATWCGPCRQEMPEVRRVYERYHDAGFEVIGISLDRNREALESYVRKEHLPWPQILNGAGGPESRLASSYGVQFIPFTVLVGRDGRIIDTGVRGSALASAVSRALSATP